MPDSNPKLTIQLHRTRDALLTERSEIIRRARELQAELDMNSTQIEAADTLMLRFNPEHVALDVRSEAEAAPMLVVGRHTLELVTTVAETKVEQLPSSASSVEKATARTKAPKKEKKAKSEKKAATEKALAPEAKLTVEEQIAAVDAALGAKAERSPERQAIATYFQTSGRNETILKILESKDEPVNASAVAKDYKALYPLPEDTATVRNLHGSRVSAALYYLKARGQVVRFADEKEGGKPAENVRWELSKSYRSELRKGRKYGRSKSSADASVSTEQNGEEIRLAAGAR